LCAVTTVTAKPPDIVTSPTDCSRLWQRKANTAAKDGVFYDGIATESACKSECIAASTCVAINFGLIGCVLHHNDSDLADTDFMPMFTLFTLDRRCLPTRPVTTDRPTTSMTSARKTTSMSYTKNIFKYMYLLSFSMCVMVDKFAFILF